MEDDHVVVIIYCALTVGCERPNDVDVGALGAGSIAPCLPKSNRLDLLRFVILNYQDLRNVS